MPFKDPVAAGPTGVLVRNSVRSANYVTGVSGWTINRDGSAEFSNVAVYGGQFKVTASDGSYVWVHSVASPIVGGGALTAIELRPPDLAGHTITLPAGIYTGIGTTQATLGMASPSLDNYAVASFYLISDDGSGNDGYTLSGHANILSGHINFDGDHVYAQGTQRFINTTNAGFLTQMVQARASSTLTMTTTNTAVPGCLINLTTLNPNARWEAEISADAIIGSTAGSTIVGTLQVNGVTQNGQAIHSGPVGARNTSRALYIGQATSFNTALSFQMFGQNAGAATGNQYGANHTSLTVKIYE